MSTLDSPAASARLVAKSIAGLLFLLVMLGAALFLPPFTFDYWQAWLFLAVFFVGSGAITVYLAVKDPALLERRNRAGAFAEPRRQQKIIQAIAQLAFLALFVTPALDRRWHWSHVPLPLVLVGDLLVAAGLLFVFVVFRTNSYAAATIEVAEQQTVISTGVYAVVRHPMYAGALLIIAGTPIALGSYWGLIAGLPMVMVFVWRLLDEERYLAEHLPGYRDYCLKVRWRLVPKIF